VTRSLRIAAAAAILLAAASLLLPYQPVYDPWAWLVWGRELAGAELATAGGPSWKPLPVMVDAPLSLLGGAAPKAWLLVARTGSLLAAALAGLVAARLAGAATGRWRFVAGLVAGASVLLAADSFTPPVRQFTGGLSEGLLVALVLGAVWLALDGRPRAALWLGVAASLLRPECWPFLAVWAVWEVRSDRSLAPHAIAAAVLVPVAWFVPDLLTAGDPLEGSGTARQGGVEPGDLVDVAGRALAAPLAAAWVGVALFLARRRSEDPADRAATVLLAGAAAWAGVVAAMAVAGFAGLPRFLAPATAAFSVVGGVGIARAGAAAWAGARSPYLPNGGRNGERMPRGRGWLPSLQGASVVAALAAAVVGFGLRAADVPGGVDTIEAQTRSQEDLRQLAERVGTEALVACGGTVRVTNVLAQTSLAWWLDEPIESVRVRRRPRFGVVLSERPLDGRYLGREGPWRAVQMPCLSEPALR
jgi:hypothetical protein